MENGRSTRPARHEADMSRPNTSMRIRTETIICGLNGLRISNSHRATGMDLNGNMVHPKVQKARTCSLDCWQLQPRCLYSFVRGRKMPIAFTYALPANPIRR